MNDLERELRTLLREDARRAPASVDPPPGLLRRTRRRRGLAATALAGLVVASSVGLFVGLSSVFSPSQERRPAGETPSPAPPPADPTYASPAERAATVAIAAVAEAGILDPKGTYYDYGAIRETDAGWRASFCLEEPPDGVCSPETADSFLEIVHDGGDLMVTEASGPFTEEQRSVLLGYREAAAPPPPALVHGAYSLEERSGRVTVTASVYWTGTIPSRLSAHCRVQILDAQGEVVGEGSEFAYEGPSVEGARDGVMMVDDIPMDGEATGARFVCGEWHRIPPENPPPRTPPEDRLVLAEGESGDLGWEVFTFEVDEAPVLGYAVSDGPWAYSRIPRGDIDPCEIESRAIFWQDLKEDPDHIVVLQLHVLPPEASTVQFLLSDGRSVDADILRVPDDRATWDAFAVVIDGPPTIAVREVRIRDADGVRLDDPASCQGPSA